MTTHLRYQTIFFLSLLMPCWQLTGLSAQATPANRSTIAPSYQISLDFKVPKRGAPPSTAGGASRGSCNDPTGKEKLPANLVLTPLMPSTRLGLTVAEHPSFFVYVPRSPAKIANFLLQSEHGETIYETNFTLPPTAGIVRFDLPQDAPIVEVGKQYHWLIATLCNPIIRFGVPPSAEANDPTVEGWIERSSPNVALTKALQKTLPGNRPALYAEAGVWHETLTTLADLRQQNPQNARLLKDWREVLHSVGLDAVAVAPLMTAVPVKQ